MLSSVGRSKNKTTFGFNPDVAFTYIDQRLQDVLGHFQKDFEREISVENLGPKFGQYGSFLPMLLRNPLTQSQQKNLDQRLQDVLGHFQKEFESEISAENLVLRTQILHEIVSLNIFVEGPKFGQYGSFLPMLVRIPLTQSQPKSLASIQSSNIPKLLKKFENMDSSTINDTLPVHEKKTLKIRLKIGVGKAPKSNSASYSSLHFKNYPSSSIEGILENKDENYEQPSSIVQAKALSIIPVNSPLSPISDSLCFKEKDNVDYGKAKLRKQPIEDSKIIGPSPAFEGDSFILEKEIHKQYMKLKLPKRCRKGHKECNMQDCSNVTKKRKECSANAGESNLIEIATENNGVFSSVGSSTKLFGEMQNKSNITKKRKECSASPGESDLIESPTENGVLSSAHSSTKLFGDLRHPIQLAKNTLKEAIDLKNSANRLKNGESVVEVSGIYLHAALKLLLAASMFEIHDMGSAALGEKTESEDIYIDTSKILKQCAISFERNGEIAAAALAYKCVEVAYMRVIFSMSSHIRKDSLELQASLHGHPFGQESSAPGSEAKGVEPLASRATSCSPHILNYAEYVSSAMDAAQRSLSALKAAQWKYGLQGIAAVKTALDFHFHDMNGFIHQVRLALEEIDI